MTTRDIELVFCTPIEERDNFDEAFDELKKEQFIHLSEALNSI